MGAKLARSVYEIAAGLSDGPVRLFVRMALSAKDNDEQPWSRLGRAEMAAALGREDDQAGHWAVERIVRLLAKAGFIARVEGGHHGRAARYALLDGSGAPLKPGAERRAIEPAKPGAGHRATAESPAPGAMESPAPDAPEARRRAPAQGIHEEEREEGRPSPVCSRHPNGTDEPCYDCKRERERAEGWTPPPRPIAPHVHLFDPTSGYCSGCGIRDDAPERQAS